MRGCCDPGGPKEPGRGWRNAGKNVLTIAGLGMCVAAHALVAVLIGGVSIGAGVVLGQIALVAAGVAGIGYVVYRVVRHRRRLTLASLAASANSQPSTASGTDPAR